MENFFKTIRSAIKHWYIPLIIGILLILLGFYVMATPLESYLTLSMFFSISFLFSGIMEIIFALSNKKEIDGWGWYLSGGILYAILGFMLLANPAISMATLPLVVGFFALFKSIQYLSFSLDLRQYGSTNWGILMFFAILGIIFSFILIWNPVFAGLTLVIWTGLAIVSSGIASCILAIQLNRLKNMATRTPEEWRKRYQELKQEYFRHHKKEE